MLDKIFATAGAVSLIDTTCTIVGSAMMGRGAKVNEEINVVLAGGVISGFIVGMYLSIQQTQCPLKHDSSLTLKLSIAALDIFLLTGAVLLTPFLGERIAHAGTNWTDVTVDSLVGISVIGGGSAAILGGIYLAANKCSLPFFSKRPTTDPTPAPQATPSAMV